MEGSERHIFRRNKLGLPESEQILEQWAVMVRNFLENSSCSLLLHQLDRVCTKPCAVSKITHFLRMYLMVSCN